LIRTLLATSALILACSCAPISLSDEASTFGTAAGKFTTSVKDADGERRNAKYDSERAVVEGLVARGQVVKFAEDCWTRLQPLTKAFDDATLLPTYDPEALDRAFAGLRSAPICALQPSAPPQEPPASKLPQSAVRDLTSEDLVAADGLADAATALDEYVAAVVDIVGNKTGAERDAARASLISSGGKLLEAKGMANAGAVTGFVGGLVSNAMAADQNAKYSRLLERYDRLLPYVLERIGHAGRLTAELALRDRAKAAQAYAGNANLLLSARGTPTERLQVLAIVSPDIARQNDAILRLRAADPMVAARRFATAHHELVAAYAGGKGSTAAASAGLQAFSKAAAELKKALAKED